MLQFPQKGFQVSHATFCILLQSEELLVKFGVLLHQTGIVSSVWFNLGGGGGYTDSSRLSFLPSRLLPHLLLPDCLLFLLFSQLLFGAFEALCSVQEISKQLLHKRERFQAQGLTVAQLVETLSQVRELTLCCCGHCVSQRLLRAAQDARFFSKHGAYQIERV